MSRTVFCKKLQKEALGLSRPPYQSELGARIFAHISQEAWQQWLRHQMLLINEHRLNVLDPQARTFLETAMQQFLFEGKEEFPPGFIPLDR